MSDTRQITATELAHRGSEMLERGAAREAGWHALYALELDPRSGVAWSVISRILGEVSHEPLGTLTARYALELPLPDDDRRGLERHHHIDLWSRGLLMHRERRAILRASEFDDPARFESTARAASWFEGEIEEWGDLRAAAEAARRMVCALSDAFDVPTTPDNPLRASGWIEKPAYRAWKEEVGRTGLRELQKGSQANADPTVLSDYWMEQEIVQLAASGLFEDALDRAAKWSELRPDRMKPKCSVLRVQYAAGREEERDESAAAIVATRTSDLNELEEARVALGELRMWKEQVQILNRMDALAPRHPVILANRGVAHLELGERESGRRDLEAALEVDPDNAPALANLGLERMRQDEYVAARALLERAVEVAPEQVMARVYLAACKNNQGDRNGAIAELEEAIRLDPGHSQAQQMLDEIKTFVVKTKPS